MNTRSLKISAVICTYNRAHTLVDALQSLCDQTLDSSEYEIIVVDNNSSDDTRALTKQFSESYSNVRYVFESRQGLSYARNRGWLEAKGEYVAYLDDDAKAPQQWLELAVDIVQSVSPGVLGGPYYAFYKSSKPRWWKDDYRSHEHAERARPLKAKEYLSGNNIIFKRSLFEQVGGFNPDLGMNGNKVAFGEETHLLQQIRRKQPNQLIYYDPRLFIYHLVPPKRMELRWIALYKFSAGRYYYKSLRRCRLGRPGIRALLKDFTQAVWHLILDLLVGTIRRDRGEYEFVQNYLYEHTARHIFQLGVCYGRLGHLFSAIRRGSK